MITQELHNPSTSKKEQVPPARLPLLSCASVFASHLIIGAVVLHKARSKVSIAIK